MKRENNNLDRLLRQWLDRTLPTGDDRSRWDPILRTPLELTQPAGPRKHRSSLAARRFALALTAAAILLAFLAGWILSTGPRTVQPASQRSERAERPQDSGKNGKAGQPEAESPRQRETAETVLTRSEDAELLRRLDLVEPLDELFGRKWAWMVECGDCVDMKVTGSPVCPASAPVVARLAIFARDAPDQQFHVQEETFILTHEQQLVEADLQDGAARELRFWVYAIDDGLYTYDVALTVQHREPLKISTSGAVRRGRPTPIVSLRHGRSEYRAVLLLEPQPTVASQNPRRAL